MPVLCIIALQIFTVPSQSGSELLEHPVLVGGSEGLLQYDDGTAWWTTWDGKYRGVWFDLADFGGSCCEIDYLEFWFYHGPWYCYDTFSFYAELWSSTGGLPETELDQTSVAGIHLAPCFSFYDPPIHVEGGFWGVINTEMSSGGWPNNIGDNSPRPAAHSFSSDDFVDWEPWVVWGMEMSTDYFTRAGVSGISGLEQTTWGAIKAIF